MATNKIDIKNMSLKDLGDLGNLQLKDFELAAALFAKAKAPEIGAKIAGANVKVQALIKIVAIITPVIIEAYKKCSTKEKAYLDEKNNELIAIQEKCNNSDLSEEEKDLLAQQEANIIIELQKRDVFKKWAKVAGIVFLVPFPANLIYYAANKKKKKQSTKDNLDK